jgi:hypothetical protein
MKGEGSSAKDLSPGHMKRGSSALDESDGSSRRRSQRNAEDRGAKSDHDRRANRHERNDRRNARSDDDRERNRSAKSDKSRDHDKNRAERNDRNDRRNARGEDYDRRGKGSAATGASEGASGRAEHKSVNLTGEQKTRVKTVFERHHVAPVTDIGVAVNVGVVIPSTVHLYPLPADIIAIVPAYRDYEYIFLDDDRVAIIDPDTFVVVDIIVIA